MGKRGLKYDCAMWGRCIKQDYMHVEVGGPYISIQKGRAFLVLLLHTTTVTCTHKRWSEDSWVLAFAFVIFLHRAYSLGECIWFGGTFKGWWNDQRMWVYKRTTSYFFGLLDYILDRLGFAKSAFVITTKVADDDMSQRMMSKRSWSYRTVLSSPMFTILATLALLNALLFLWRIEEGDCRFGNFGLGAICITDFLCGLLVLINLPVYTRTFLQERHR
ncbi:cellulose synthase-like protein e1 [Quercus suber]|uniref:Cellulose synthase-like protein e1 n=1 Tax=Quercus suber TaxID=58331 RepID=A0AAW0L8B6_QUESU